MLPAHETDRLILRRLEPADRAFILALVNEPTFLRYIGDRGVRTLEDAERYIEGGPRASYDRHGFGLYLVETKADRRAIGICGLIKRDELDAPDVGFAFLPAFGGCGFAYESAKAVLDDATAFRGFGRILAIVSPDNDRSIRLLEKLGFRFERMIRMKESEPEIRLYAAGERTEAPAR